MQAEIRIKIQEIPKQAYPRIKPINWLIVIYECFYYVFTEMIILVFMENFGFGFFFQVRIKVRMKRMMDFFISSIYD